MLPSISESTSIPMKSLIPDLAIITPKASLAFFSAFLSATSMASSVFPIIASLAEASSIPFSIPASPKLEVLAAPDLAGTVFGEAGTPTPALGIASVGAMD